MLATQPNMAPDRQYPLAVGSLTRRQHTVARQRKTRNLERGSSESSSKQHSVIAGKERKCRTNDANFRALGSVGVRVISFERVGLLGANPPLTTSHTPEQCWIARCMDSWRLTAAGESSICTIRIRTWLHILLSEIGNRDASSPRAAPLADTNEDQRPAERDHACGPRLFRRR